MNKKVNKNQTNLVFEELEARLLLSADPLGVIAETSLETSENTIHVDHGYHMMVANQAEQSPAVVLNNPQSSHRAELVIIDSRAPNFQQLHNDVIMAQQQGRDINVLILDAHRDGIQQISEALSKYDKLDAVHIVSHGNDAQLQLGAMHLNQHNLQQRSDEISQWKEVFTEGGDLLIYGCDLAGSTKGTALANSLGQLTGADVAASDDLTGNVRLGGDWELEYSTGDIETKVAFSTDLQQNWQGTLDGSTASGAAAEDAANEERRQQERLAQQQLDQQEAALREEQKVAASQLNQPQQAVIAEERRQEIVIIDESVADYQSFIDDLTANNDESTNFEIFLINDDSNGVEQINKSLSAYNDVDALHIISHGEDGAIKLGNTWLNAGNLEQYSNSLTAWGSSLDQHADILIYGCNLTESTRGEQFVDQLAQLTGADVAASDDRTGNALLDGDWELEYQVGAVEAQSAVSAELQQEYQSILAIAVDDTVNVTEDTPTIIDLVANDTGAVGMLTVLDLTAPANGSVVNNGDGTVTYTPDTNYNGGDTFDYIVSDSNDGRTHYWNLDGDADDAIGTNHGTLVNGPTTVAGQFGNGLSFDEVDDHIVIPDVTYTNEFTVSLQFKLDDNSGSDYQYLYSHGAFGTSNSLNILIGESGQGGADANQLIVRFADANDPTGIMDLNWDVSSIINDGLWHTFTMVVESGVGSTVYIDGAFNKTHANGGDGFNPTGDVYLGAREDLNANRFYGGELDSVQIHDNALNASQVNDLHTWANQIATANITVTAVNDAPLATNLSAAESYTEDSALNLTDIVISDVDSANVTATLTLSDVAAGSLNVATSGAVTSSFVGGVWSASGAIADVNTLLAGVTFTPSLNYDSNFSIATSVDDGVAPAITGTKVMTATAVNDRPVIIGVSNLTPINEDDVSNPGTLVSALMSSSDVDIGAVSGIAVYDVDGNTNGAWEFSTNSGGTWTAFGLPSDTNVRLLAADASTYVRFVPNADFNGVVSGVSFRAWDQTVGTAGGTIDMLANFSSGAFSLGAGGVNITVFAANDAPLATNLSAAESYTEDNALNLTDIVISDVDSANVTATLTLSDVAAGSLNVATSGAVTSSFVGGVWSASGAIADVNTLLAGVTFTPSLNYSSNFSIATSVDDGVAPAITGTKVMTATAANDAPLATNLSAAESYTEDSALNLTDIVISDVDSANVTATLTLSDVAAGSLNVATSGAVTSSFVGGVWSASGAIADVNTLLAGVTFTPSLNYDSNFSIATSVDDGVAPAITGTKVMTATAVNDVPVANTDNFTVNEGSVTNLDLAGNDVDVDDGLDLNSIVITAAPANGSLVINGDGTVDYTHDGSETLSDSFSYMIADITGATSTATVNLTITPLNDAPTAVADTTSVNEGASLNIDLAANDFDVDNTLDLNSIVITVAPVNGSLVTNGDGTVTYTHDGSPTLSDSFSYTIADISGAISNVASVTITVIPLNSAPTTSGIADVTVNEDSAASTIDLHAAFDDSDNLDSELTYSITGNTNIGLFSSTAVNAAMGELVLNYAADMNGSSQISMRATDPSGAFVDTLFSVTVTPVNDAPVIVANTGITAAGANAMTITNAELNSSDIDNLDTALTYTVTALPDGDLMINGVVATLGSNFSEADLINNRLSYRASGTSASDQFEFTVSDGAGGTLLGNRFNILVQLAATEPEDPIDPVTVDPEVPDPVITPPDPEVGLPPVTPVDPTDEYGGGFTPIGSNTPVEPKPEPEGGIEEPLPEADLEEKASEEDFQEVIPEESLVEIKSFELPRVNVEPTDYDIRSNTGYNEIKVKSINALFTAMDEMNDQIDEQAVDNQASVEFQAAAVSSSSVALTAGAVAWVLRSGALMTSLMATMPVWRGYDPLPILKYRDDEDDEETTEVKIPTSLEEARKVRALKEKLKKENQVDFLFGEGLEKEHAGV